MKTKKLLSTLLSAVMAVIVLASCGGAKNYSAEATKAANAAQNTIVFETDTVLAKSLQNALKNHTQTSDVKAAMAADRDLKDLLTSGHQLDVFAMQADNAQAAAEAIAEKVAALVAGKMDEGKIAMVLADNGYYYAAVLTYRNASSSNGGDDSGEDEPEEPEEPETPSITVNGQKVEAGGTPVKIEAENGSFTVEVKEEADGLTMTIIPTPAEGYMVSSVTVDGQAITAGADGSYIVSVQNGASVSVSVVFESKGYTIDGNGTYIVTNENGLKAWAEAAKEAEEAEKDPINCTLADDITLTSWSSFDYKGTFDGANHTITMSGTFSTGLFTILEGNVKSLTLDLSSGKISAESHNIGSIANNNHGSITDCTVMRGEVSGTVTIGGVVGQNYGTIKNCSVTGANITATSKNYWGDSEGGGIVGKNNGRIESCIVQDTTITTTSNKAGGIAGNNQNTGSAIIGCIAKDCTIKAASQAGGITGYNQRNKLSGCAAVNCMVDAESDENGIVGKNKGDDVTACYWNEEGTVYKYDSETSSWSDAVTDMNNNGSQFILGTDGTPTLNVGAASTAAGKLLQAARMFGL